MSDNSNLIEPTGYEGHDIFALEEKVDDLSLEEYSETEMSAYPNLKGDFWDYFFKGFFAENCFKFYFVWNFSSFLNHQFSLGPGSLL